MALSEQRIVKQVSILPEQSAINVQWANQILRDGVVISETYERRAYSIEQKEEFLAEVENAEGYIQAASW
jgi:hypothetical protein